MSLIAKSTYMASKADLVANKIQPILDSFNSIKTMGVNMLQTLDSKISTVTSSIIQLENEMIEEGTKAQRRLLEKLNTKKSDLVSRLDRMKSTVTETKTDSLNRLEPMIQNSVSGISGINIEFDMTYPDPVTGEGGSISAIPTPDLIDESTLLVDQTLTDPTTVVTVIGTSASGGPVTGTGVITTT